MQDAPKVTLFGHSGFKATDHALVGMPALNPARPFTDHFATYFRPRLEKRAEGFTVLFDALARMPGPRLILETGTLRLAGNWEGDGQSSYMFDMLLQHEASQGRPGAFFSIDLDPASIAAARAVLSATANLICNDSVYALHTLSRQMRGRQVALLYLDSFDLDLDDPMPSATHHMMELSAASPLLGSGSLVAIDDYKLEGQSAGGKGKLVDLYMESINAAVIHSSYQKIWRIP